MQPSPRLSPLRRSPCTPSRLVRTVGVVAAATLAVAAIPASASAAVRTGSVQDPQSDASALSGPVLDIKSAAVRYDDSSGTVQVTWTYYDDVRPHDAEVGGGLWLDAPAGSSTPSAWVGWSHMPDQSGQWSLTTRLSLSYVAGTLSGTGSISDDGRVITAEFTNPQLANRDWQHGFGSVWGGDTVSDFWFDGYGAPNPPIQPPVGPPAPDSTPPAGSGGATSGDQGMTINGGALYTNDPDVTLSVIAPSWAKTLRVANDGGFGAAKTFSVSNKLRWRLAESGSERLPKTVYLRFGNDAQNFTDDIILDQTAPTVSAATLASSSSRASSAFVASAASSRARTYLVRLRATDQTSGVAKVQFASNRRRPAALRKFERNSRYKGAGAPKYVRVQDRAGNFSRWRSIR